MSKPKTSDSKILVRSWLQQEAAEPSAFGFCCGSVVVCSYKCPGKESENEDAAVVIEFSPEHGILAVADGIGGHNAGDRAAQTVIEAISGIGQPETVSTSLRAQILDSIEAANREVLSWGMGAGSTLVVAEYLAGKIRVIHVGDSGALVTSNRGRNKFFAVAHAPVAMAVESGMMKESEAMIHEDRNLISNCIGSEEMKIEVGPELSMAARDTLVMASDGLFDNLTTAEVVAAVRVGDLCQQTQLLTLKTRRRMQAIDSIRGKPDDLTVVCFRQCRIKDKGC